MDKLTKFIGLNKECVAILAGELNPNNASDEVKTWLQLTTFNLACMVAAQPTKEDRQYRLHKLKIENPAFYDDVKQLAVEIYKTGQTTTR